MNDDSMKYGKAYWSSHLDQRFITMYKNANLFIKVIQVEFNANIYTHSIFMELALTKLVNESDAKFQLV